MTPNPEVKAPERRNSRINKSYFIPFIPKEVKNMASQLAYIDAKTGPWEKEKTGLFITLLRIESLGRVNFY